MSGFFAGDRTYTHTQGTPDTTWTVAHNLGKKPSVAVLDSTGNLVMCDVAYVDANSLTLTFSVALGGEAICN